MAEAAGLAIGAIGLARLFTTCIECIDYVSLRRNYGRDYETSITKLILLNARLSAWGESLLVTYKGEENAALRERWREEQSTVGKCLVGIKSMLEDSEQIESRYGLKPFSTDQSSLLVPRGHVSKVFRQIEDKFESCVQWQQEDASMSKKARWAICDKNTFDSLIADLAFFIGRLEDLSDRLQV